MGKKIGRNNPCPCGSGKKYKKCCLNKDEQARLANPVHFRRMREVSRRLADEYDKRYAFIKYLEHLKDFPNIRSSRTAFECYVDWYLLNYNDIKIKAMEKGWRYKEYREYAGQTKTPLDYFLETDEDIELLSPEELTTIQQWRSASPSVYRIDQFTPGTQDSLGWSRDSHAMVTDIIYGGQYKLNMNLLPKHHKLFKGSADMYLLTTLVPTPVAGEYMPFRIFSVMPDFFKGGIETQIHDQVDIEDLAGHPIAIIAAFCTLGECLEVEYVKNAIERSPWRKPIYQEAAELFFEHVEDEAFYCSESMDRALKTWFQYSDEVQPGIRNPGGISGALEYLTAVLEVDAKYKRVSQQGLADKYGTSVTTISKYYKALKSYYLTYVQAEDEEMGAFDDLFPTSEDGIETAEDITSRYIKHLVSLLEEANKVQENQNPGSGLDDIDIINERLETDRIEQPYSAEKSLIHERNMRRLQNLIDNRGLKKQVDIDAFIEKNMNKMDRGHFEHELQPESDSEKAEEYVFQAFLNEDPSRRIQLVKKALKLDPSHPDAYTILAQEAASTDEALWYYQQGMAVGEAELGEDFLATQCGASGEYLKARPYMRAKKGYAALQHHLGALEEAINAYYDLLESDPEDHMQVRHPYIQALLEKGLLEEAELVIDSWDDDSSTFMMYARVLHQYLQSGLDDRDTIDWLLAAARKQNRYVPQYLTRRRQPKYTSETWEVEGYEPGTPVEAEKYLDLSEELWKKYPELMEYIQYHCFPKQFSLEDHFGDL